MAETQKSEWDVLCKHIGCKLGDLLLNRIELTQFETFPKDLEISERKIEESPFPKSGVGAREDLVKFVEENVSPLKNYFYFVYLMWKTPDEILKDVPEASAFGEFKHAEKFETICIPKIQTFGEATRILDYLDFSDTSFIVRSQEKPEFEFLESGYWQLSEKSYGSIDLIAAVAFDGEGFVLAYGPNKGEV